MGFFILLRAQVFSDGLITEIGSDNLEKGDEAYLRLLSGPTNSLAHRTGPVITRF